MNPQGETQKGFTPPRHWMSLEELSSDYWSDAKEMELRGQEFQFKPIETLEKIESMDQSGTTRRNFLKIMGASMALAGTACVRRPVQKIIPYVVKPESITPGVASYYASTCMECSVGCGVLAKNREGRPIKLEGNPDHPVSAGALCSRGQASILNLYDPDRLRAPQLRSGGMLRASNWDALDSEVVAAIRANPKGVRVLSRAHSSPTKRELIREFLASVGSTQGQSLELEVSFDSAEAWAQSQAYGDAVVPSLRLEKAKVIVSLASDFLATGSSPIQNSADWVKNRVLQSKQAGASKMSKFYAFESVPSVTGSNADERFPIQPGQEVRVAYALLNELVSVRKLTNWSLPAVVASASIASVAHDLGIDEKKLKSIVDELLSHRGESLVVAGSISALHPQAKSLALATAAINAALGNDGKTLDGVSRVRRAPSDLTAISELVNELQAGKVSVLILDHCNPAYELPHSMGFADAIKKANYVVSLQDREDETAKFAHAIASTSHYLESWGDSEAVEGVRSLVQPAVAALYETRSSEDTWIAWAAHLESSQGRLGKVASGSNATFHEYLRETWREKVWKMVAPGTDFELFWNQSLKNGVVQIAAPASKERAFRPLSLMAVESPASLGSGPLFVAYEKVSIGDGRSANNAWLQEMPDPMTTVVWDNHVNLSPAMAARLGVAEGDLLEVALSGGKLKLPAFLLPGMADQTVAVAIGYGREAAGVVGNLVGQSVMAVTSFESGSWSLAGVPAQVRKTGGRYELAVTQGHHRSENRPVINDITLAEFRKNPATANHTDPHLRMDPVPTMWDRHEYKGYRWGMSIDLNACTGCGACVVACQAENNIPVVGRDQVRWGREMHWIRIDRYFSGSETSPEVVFQPMLCQHCENAPCETVCPVLATVHSDEGLNDMAYNRCVGTRYCQNNCPYKVRRFNFFDHWKATKEPQQLAYNPDVSVRSRGVMEKCSFCVQRINDVKGRAKVRGEKVKDGSLVTACQQTCPTGAIIFGDMNDSTTQVAGLMKEAHAFRSLEVINTRPSVSYLSKVRNANKEGVEHGHHG